MSRRPFPVEFTAQLLPAPGNLQLVVRTNSAAQAQSPEMALLNEIIGAIAVIGGWGALPAQGSEPCRSSLTLLAAAQPLARNERVWLFQAERVHPALFTVLLNAVHRFHLQGHDIQWLGFHSTSSGLPADAEATAELPQHHEPCPFPVSYEVESAQVLVDVDFVAPADPGVMDGFTHAMDAWVWAAMNGAFADENYLPGASTLAVDDELTLTSTGFSLALDDVGIADAGFDAMVNMLQTLHRRGVAIDGVVIE